MRSAAARIRSRFEGRFSAAIIAERSTRRACAVGYDNHREGSLYRFERWRRSETEPFRLEVIHPRSPAIVSIHRLPSIQTPGALAVRAHAGPWCVTKCPGFVRRLTATPTARVEIRARSGILGRMDQRRRWTRQELLLILHL